MNNYPIQIIISGTHKGNPSLQALGNFKSQAKAFNQR
jgi:hypothetical protein